MPKVIGGKSQMSDNENVLTYGITTDTSVVNEMCLF